jgi:amino acid adenylation domain-containing protein
MAEPELKVGEDTQGVFVFPASSAQERLWFLAGLEPGSSAYNCHRSIRFAGPLRLDVLAAALGRVVDRHETLRTCFGTVDGEVVQIVHSYVPLPLPVIDLDRLPPARRERKALQLARREANRPFDLRQAPLLAFFALRLGAAETVLVFTQHHIVTDGWSMNILVREISAIYRSLCQGRPADLPELPIQYADFAVWQRERFKGASAAGRLDYWRRQLEAAPQLLELPLDHPRQPGEGFLGLAKPKARITETLSRAFLELVRRQEATPFMGLLAVFEVLMLRWTGQEDFLVGTPVSGRDLLDTEGLVGFFVNLLALRARPTQRLGFRQLLAKVRSEVLEAFAHQDVPFSKVIEAVRNDRGWRHGSLFQVLFTMEQEREAVSGFADVEVTALSSRASAAKFDLSMTTAVVGHRLDFLLEYRGDLFDAATIGRLVSRCEALVAAVVSHPDVPLETLDLLPREELHQILCEWNGGALDYPREGAIHEVFAAAAAHRPDKVAVVWRDQSLTYRELDRRAAELARRLRRLGVGPEVPVALYLERTPRAIVGILGILKAGGFYLPLDLSYPAQRLADMLEDSRPRVILTEKGLAGGLLQAAGTRVCLDDPWSAGPEDAASAPRRGTGAAGTAYVMYTSGSTGRPKGVQVAHRGVVRLVKQDAYARLGQDEIFLQAAPISFDASTLEIWGPLLNGGRLVLYEEEEISLEGLERAIQRHGVTTLWLTAGLFQQVVEMRAEALGGVRQLLAGGDVLPPPRVEKLLREQPAIRLINGYGPTENTTFTCCHPVAAPPLPGGTVPIGRPIANTQVYVLSPWLQLVPVGSFGELCAGGDGLARGYLGQPALTAERFVPHPFAIRPGERLYRTGDLVRWLPAGSIEFSGRIDDQVKLRGFRVEPGEVEALLSRHQAVREAAVVVREDRPGDKRLVAFVVPAAGARDKDTELLSSLRLRLPAYMVPSSLVWLDELPRTASGKVHRRALLAVRAEPAPQAPEETAGPLTAVEAVMAEIWAEVLGTEHVGLSSSFFDLGGHSLLAMQVISRVRKIFEVELPMRSLFENDTVRALAACVEKARRDELGVRLPAITPARRVGPIPLSFAQQRLWFLDQLAPGSTAYNVPAAWYLSGRLRIASLAAAVTEIVRRHESLRTTFHSSADGPFQMVALPAAVQVPVVDVSGLLAGDREAEAQRLIAAEAGRPFDLARGPLLRVALLRLESAKTAALVTMHHIVSDGWSMGILGRESSVLEEAFAQGRPSPLPELPIQYADFAIWQRQVVSEGALAVEIEYWQQQLRGAPAVTDLPLDRPRSTEWTDLGAVRSSVLSPALSAALRALGRRQGATLFMTVLSGFQALLARFATQPDISVGTPVAGRRHLETEGLIGFFVNVLVLRTRFDDDPSFGQLVQRVRGVTLEAHAHQDVPFEELVEKLQPERSLAISPLFQAMFAVQNSAAWRHGLSGLEARTAEIERRTTKFDLSLSVLADAAGLELALEYNRSLFDGTTVIRLLAALERLLAAAAGDPELRLSALPAVSPAERQQLTSEWNDTAEPAGWPGAVHEQIAARARRAPEAAALEHQGETLSYGELDSRAERLARHLRRLGVGREQVVGLCVERSVEMIVGLLAVLKAGGAYLPLDPTYPQERLDLLLSAAPVNVVLTKQHLARRLPMGHWSLIYLDRSQPHEPGERPEELPAPAWPEQQAYLIYTSGSTGRPKAVVALHGALANYTRVAAREFGLGPGDRVLQFASISFDTSAEEIFPTLAAGATLVLRGGHSVAAPAQFLETCERERLTVLNLPTAYWHELAEASGREGGELPATVRLVVIGGERALPERVAQWCRATRWRALLVNTYGPTETTIVATGCRLVEPERSWEPISIGRPVGGVRAYVLSRALDLAPLGATGELAIGGVGLARGYLDRPAATAEQFVPDPFSPFAGSRLYRTGDRVRWLADGRLDFIGRLDGQVKVRGYRIELGEIETALTEYPLVRDAVVAVRQDAPGEPRLVAYVVPRELAQPTAVELRGFLQEVLPDYMVPSAFVLLEALPLTITGKVDRRALPAPGMDRSSSSAPFVAPRTPVEEVVSLIWAELLRVDRVGVHDNFFELGGHSLLATQVISRVRNNLQVEVPVRALFERPTLSGFAYVVESARRSRGGFQMPPLEPADRAVELPLSFAQQRLWFIDQFEPGNPVYNVALGVRLRGTLLVPALEGAWAEVVRRHEVLRTSYASSQGRAVQVIAETPDGGLAMADLGGLPAPARDSELRRLAHREAERPFDLSRGPVFRVLVQRLGDDDHVLLATIHHIACDAWSMEILWREVTALYLAFCQGKPSPLAPLAVQYADYAAWQRRWLQGEVLDAQLAYWKRQLAGDLPPLELPTDRPRPALQTFRGRHLPWSLPGAGQGGLLALARRESATPFMALLAAYQVLLRRYSGQSDISVGTPISGRNRVELEGLIGFFLNTLVIRVGLPGEPSFLDLLRRVRALTLEAYACQDLPFEKLVDELRPKRSLSHSPLFQVLFVLLHQAQEEQQRAAGLEASPFNPEPETAKFDLTWSTNVGEQEISGLIEYNVDLFDRTTIQHMSDHLRNLVEAIGANPESPVSALTLLGSAERQQLVLEWNDTGRLLPRGPGVHQLFERQAERSPDRPAVVFAGQHLSYGELNRRANRLAHALRALGVGPESRVALSLERSLEMTIGLLGILKAGAAYVPIDPTYPRPRRLQMLEDASVSVLVTQERLRGEVWEEGLQAVCLDAGWEAVALHSGESLDSGVCEEGLAYVIFTSGSTGRPKGVALPHAVLRNLVEWHLATLLTGARTLQFASLGFDVSFYEMFVCWASGGILLAVAETLRRDAGALAGFLVETASEKAILPVVMVHHLAEEYGRRQVLPPLREITTTGEQLQTSRAMADLLGRLGGCVFHNQYGPTESHVVTGFTLSSDPDLWVSHPPIGRPISNTTVYLLDRQLLPVPIGLPGELYIGGVCLARGYLNRPQATAERFVPDPFGSEPGARLYRTGDKVRRLASGDLDFMGRFDHQVKVRGFRVELEEIEQVLGQHSTVRQNVVLAREDLPGDVRLVAYLVADAAGSPGDWRAFLQERLPDYMVPSHFVVLDALPLTVNGKVDRKALPAPEVLRGDLLAAYVPPRSLAEEVLASIWAGVLGLERVGVEDDFFELGGHSLLATQVVSRVRSVFAVELPLRALFKSPTVAGLAVELEALLAGAGRDAAPPLQRVPRDGDLPLSFAQQRLWFLDQLEPGSPAYNIALPLRINGELSASALTASLGEVVRRHEVLRTVFVTTAEGDPVQRILPAMAMKLPLVDLGGLAAGAREPELARLAREDAERPFDLARGPLFRAGLVRLGGREYALLLAQHHIVTDGWSLGVLVREGAALYQAFSAGHSSPLPELAVQYGDFAVWQRRWLADELGSQMTYWRRQLAALPVLDLPTDRPRRPLGRRRGALAGFAFSAELSRSLTELGRREGATPFITLLACLQVLLSRYTGGDDVAIGTPVANRRRLELEELIGFFVNTLVLRGDLSGRPSFRDLLRRALETALEAYAHQDVPFEQLVEDLQPERNPSRTPLFQVMLALQNAPRVEVELPGLQLTSLGVEAATARFDLTLSVVAREGLLEGAVEYDRDLFDGSTIARMLGHLERFAVAVVAQPAAPVASLDPLSRAERHQLLADWALRAAAPGSAARVHQRIAAWARRSPDALALAWEGGHLSYGELDRRASRLAGELRRRGVDVETVVAVLLERSADLVVAALAVLAAGGAYLPLDPAYPRERLELMLRESSALLVLTRTQLSGLPLLDGLDVLCLDAAEESAEDEQPPARHEGGAAPENRAYVIYTSGSTGRPKGIEVTHAGLENLVAWHHRVYGVGPGDRASQTATPSFDASVLEIWPLLAAGASLHFVPEEIRPSSERMAEWLAAHGITVAFLATPLAEELLARDRVEIPSLRLLTTGGARLRRRPRRRAGFRVVNQYGPTETAVVATFGAVDAESAGAPPIGRPVDGAAVYVQDREGLPLPLGVYGELCVGGAGLARGYLSQPDRTAERFVPDPFAAERGQAGARLYRTGDRVRWLPDGELDFLDRVDHQVKVHGHRIEPAEIETALLAQPDVRQAVVLAEEIPGDPGSLQLVAYVVGDGGERAAALRAALSTSLPAYMMPSRVLFLPELPLTASGKVDRRALAAAGREGRKQRSTKGPRDVLELRLCRIWQEVLGVRWVGVDENFFALGGHSMLAVRLMAGIERELGRRLPITTLFQASTVESLAWFLRQGMGAPSSRSLVEIRASGTRPPMFWVHPGGGGVLCYARLAHHLGADQPFYALQARGLSGEAPPRDDFTTMAAAYIAELREIQPAGPYWLGGWSLGGLIAFEMARQLRQEGQEIASLVLLDTHLPDPGLLPERMGARQLLAALALQIGVDPGELAAAQEELAELPAAEQLQPLLERAHRAGVATTDFSLADLRRLHETFVANLRAAASYQPRPLDVPILLFQADETRPIEHRGVDSSSWASLARGAITVMAAPGDHYSMLREPHAELLAQLLREENPARGRSSQR